MIMLYKGFPFGAERTFVSTQFFCIVGGLLEAGNTKNDKWDPRVISFFGVFALVGIIFQIWVSFFRVSFQKVFETLVFVFSNLF